MRVFKDEKYGNWETVAQNHLLNGETIKCYLSVRFQRGMEPTVQSIDIEPTRWWFSCYLTKNHTVKPLVFIADWKEIVREEKDEIKTEITFEEPEEKAEEQPLNFS